MSSPIEIKIPVPWGHIAGKMWNGITKRRFLVIHGLADNCGSFDRVLDGIREKHTYVSIDLPGHGLSSHFGPGIMYHFTDLVIAAKKVVDYLKWENFSFIGHSLGGKIGMHFCAFFPNTIINLILIDPIGGDYNLDCNFSRIQLEMRRFFALKNSPEKAPVYTYDEIIKKLGNRLSKAAAEKVAERNLVKANSKSGYNLTIDQRLKIHAFPTITYAMKEQVILSISCPTLAIFTSARWKQRDKETEELLPLFANKPNIIVTFVDGDHDLHQNDPEKIVYFINLYLEMCKCKL